MILSGAGRSLVVQCPELSSPTLEAQAQHLAGAPRPCQLHDMEEKKERKKKKKKIDSTPKQIVKAKLNKQNHTKKHTQS